ncbi:MAG: transcription elongation factor GreA [Thermodesulfovibrionia bacterium]|nr:transcription elongation factor GreA [Thermodesulfovibrionia bacterium]
MQKIPMTPTGHKKLKEELEKLITVERPAITMQIKIARAHGDLSENAEYHAAKEKQSFIEGRIMELQGKITHANVIDPSKISQDTIAFGAKVRLSDTETGSEKIFCLVGSDEIDIKAGRISINSPVARSLIGKAIGDIATVTTPTRTIEYEVIEITFE